MTTTFQTGKGIPRTEYLPMTIDMRRDGFYVDYRHFESNLGEKDIAEANQKFIKIFDKIRKRVNQKIREECRKCGCEAQPGELPLQHRQAAIKFTAGEKNEWLKKLVKISVTNYKYLMESKGWQKIADVAAQQDDGKLSITVRGDEFPILWELCYLKPFSSTPDPADFWGFKHLISRDIAKSDQTPLGKIRLSKILFGKYGKLHFVLEEENILRSLAKRRQAFFSNIEDELNKHWEALNPSDTFEKLFYVLKRTQSGLIHLACHTKEPSVLILSFGDTECNFEKGLLLSYEDFSDHRLGFHERPFVFLNTCLSSEVEDSFSLRDFTRDFLDFNAGGGISTVCNVPDIFASMFAIEFYKRLFGFDGEQIKPDAALSVGKALLETRLHFLEKYNNPLGLAYISHARNEARITR